MMFRCLVILSTFAFFCSAMGAPPPKPILLNEPQLWRSSSLLQKVSKKLSPLGKPAGDGAVGLNIRFPDKVLVEHQARGWNWIRAGTALGNGYIVDRGVMAFEWAFARMRDDGSFGESKTIEIAHFLGLYARSILFLRQAGLEEKAKRLERLRPRLEASLRSPRSLQGERRWDLAEKKSWMTSQRIQAAAAAFWIGRLLGNPALRKTSDLWLSDSLTRQQPGGLFPNADSTSGALARTQTDALEALQGLAWADVQMSLKLRSPIQLGFKWLQTIQARSGADPIATITYAAWMKDPAATKTATRLLK